MGRDGWVLTRKKRSSPIGLLHVQTFSFDAAFIVVVRMQIQSDWKKLFLSLITPTTGSMTFIRCSIPHLPMIRPTESQKPWVRVCIAHRKVFARPESFCAYIQNWPLNEAWSIDWVKKFPDCLESFLDSLESFRTVWKVSDKSGKFPISLESFRIVWKVSG